MSIQSIPIARVGLLLSGRITASQVDSTQAQLLAVEEQLSTGKSINAPSDNPSNAAVAIQLQKTLDLRQGYLINLQTGQSQLSEVDSTLGNLTDLLQQAQNIASSSVGSDVTQQQRQANAEVVKTIYHQALSIANTQFNGSYIFGGDKSNAQPFVSTPGGVQFVGSSTVLANTDDPSTNLAFMVDGSQVFGAVSSRVQGSVNLSPNLTALTRISDLGGATNTGVQPGSIVLSNGTVTKTIDLSGADTIGDVVNAINAAGVGGITASITGQGLTLTGAAGDNISVQDKTGTTAADLGILDPGGSGAGNPLVGSSTQPHVTPLTPISALNGGAGIDTTHGLKITNGSQSAVVTFGSATNVQDLINAINGSGTSVKAEINAAGTGIDILNPTQGSQLTIAENGGTTAADLGLRSFSPTTPLSQLNDGKGVNIATSGGDFQITRTDGTSFNVSLAGAKTVQDVINDINTASGGVGVNASFSTTGNSIVLTDSAGGAGTLTVTQINNSTAAADLGLTTPAVGNTITGSDANPVTADGIFSHLNDLINSLNSGDTTGITNAAEGLTADQNRVIGIHGQVGAQVQEMQSRQLEMQNENTATQSLLSQLTDTDFASAASKFQTLQTSLQATLMASGKSLNQSLLDFLQ